MTGARYGFAAVAASLLLALGTAACSSGSSKGNLGSTTTTTTKPAGPPSAAVSRAEITHAFKVLFNLSNPDVEAKLAVVQDGQSLKSAMTAALHSSLAKLAGGATVSSIKIESGSACQSESLSSPCALVTYSIVSPKGQPLLANSKGFAVYEAPEWKVSKATICTLLTISNGNKAPAGC